MTTRSTGLAVITAVVSLLLLSGCVPGSTTLVFVPGIWELRKACKETGGDKIYRRVEAEGYFKANSYCNRNCLVRLIRSGFQYIEYQEEVKKPGDLYSGVMKAPGIWKIYKSDKKDPQCSLRLEKEFKNVTNPRLRDVLDYFDNKCLAARKLEQPESRYWYRHSDATIYKKHGGGVEIIKQRSVIEDVEKKRVLASRNWYLLFPYINTSLSYGQSFGCSSVGVNIKPNTLYDMVLKPLKTDKEATK